MQRNTARMQQRMDAQGVRLRPHVKTSKSVPVAAAQRAAGASGITVSTLKEAEQFFAAGTTDILYAVSMAPHRLPQALQLRRRGCDRSEEHTSELQSPCNLVCRLLLEKKKRLIRSSVHTT